MVEYFTSFARTPILKYTQVAIVRSLLYQIYQVVYPNQDSLVKELEKAMEKAGQPKAVNISDLWQIFSLHVGKAVLVTVIIDALDECREYQISGRQGYQHHHDKPTGNGSYKAV